MSQPTFLIAQITDTHLFAQANSCLLGLKTLASLQAVLKQIQALDQRPDLLLLTGDLSQDGTAESYEILQTYFSPLGIPTVWVPGNHDQPETMAQVLWRSPISAQKSFRAGGWQHILLDCCLPGCVHGYLSPESLEWLDQQLQHCQDLPTLIAFHHPPFPVGSDWMKDIGLRNAQDLFHILDAYTHVKLALFGHIHQEFSRSRNGVRYLGTPSTCIQFKPNSSQFSLDESQPGFRLITLYPNGEWNTSIQRISYAEQPDLASVGY